MGDEDNADSNAMRRMLERQIDGIVLISPAPVPGNLELFERARVPIVIVGQHADKRYRSFGSDRRKGSVHYFTDSEMCDQVDPAPFYGFGNV